jgi:two-component system OmpR family sensor kinase
VASLRDRLLVGIGAFVLVTGLAAGGVAFKGSFDEAIELQDSMLVQIGALVVAHGVQPPAPVGEAVDAEARITIEELGDAGKKAEGTQALPGLPANLPDGLQTVARGGEGWRLVVRTRADGSRVAVGQPTAIRDESATNSALRTVLPLAALIPCLTLLVAIVIHRTLRPVLRLADRLDAKRSDDFEKLPLDGMPAELRPFIASINRLLVRVGTMVDQNRRFIADAAHELRTPITALGIQAENLDRIDLPPDRTPAGTAPGSCALRYRACDRRRGDGLRPYRKGMRRRSSADRCRSHRRSGVRAPGGGICPGRCDGPCRHVAQFAR